MCESSTLIMNLENLWIPQKLFDQFSKKSENVYCLTTGDDILEQLETNSLRNSRTLLVKDPKKVIFDLSDFENTSQTSNSNTDIQR